MKATDPLYLRVVTLLRSTEMTMMEIAQRVGLHHVTIKKINKAEGVRTYPLGSKGLRWHVGDREFDRTQPSR